MAQVTMSLNEIRAFRPCYVGWKKLLVAQGGEEAADFDKQIPLLDILESNGIRDAIWCMRVKWFMHKPLFIAFVNSCASRAKKHAAATAADAYAYACAYDAAATATAAAADAYADAATAAAAAAAADATATTADAYAYACAYEAERKIQTNHLKQLLISTMAPS